MHFNNEVWVSTEGDAFRCAAPGRERERVKPGAGRVATEFPVDAGQKVRLNTRTPIESS